MARELEAGMVLGRYRLEERVGEGGMGSVWRARDEMLERDVGLKALPRSLVTDASAERRFEREARAMGRLQHPNVVGIYDIGTADPGTGEELPFLVMELVHGRSLNELIHTPRDFREILRWMEQVARALSAAHEAGIVHRDLKPSNIMIDNEGHVVVLDFGLARLTQRDGEISEETLTTPGMVLGSCPYMAPEQALGHEVTPASDIFSFGTVLYEAVTGERAFKGETPMRVLQAVVRCEAVPAEDLAAGLPRALYEIIDRCLAREPSDRYADAAELGKDLSTLLAIEASSPSAATTLVQHQGEVAASKIRRQRRRRLIAAVAITAAIVGAVAGIRYGRHAWEPLRPNPGLWAMSELLQGSGGFYRPAWSPDGKHLALDRARDERGDVIIVPLDGDEPRILAEGEGHEIPGRPDFSPDSAAVALTVLTGSGQSVQVVPAVGGPPVIEIDNALNGVWLDRSRLLFTRVEDGRSAVWSVHLETGREEKVIDATDEISWWSVKPRPGGGFALLGGASDLSYGVFVAEEDGGGIEEWLAPGRSIFGVDWTPDGGALVASVGGQLWKLSDSGSEPLLPLHRGSLRYPDFSPDGRLAGVRTEPSYDLISVDPDGGPPDCLLCNVPKTGWGSLVTGRTVVFRRQVGSSWIYVRDETGRQRRLTDPDEAASCPVASPDDTRLAYLARTDGVTELRVRPVDGGEPVVLAENVESSEFVSWSPDGSKIAYAGGAPLRVWVVSAAGGTPEALSGPGGDYPSWSPDGSQLAYSIWTEESDPDQGTWVVGADGRGARKVGDLPTRVVWDPVDGGLMQLRRSAAGDSLELWRLGDDRGGWTRRATLDLGARPPVQMEFLPLTIDPDSGRLVMNRLTVTSRLVVFDGVDVDRW